MYHTLSQLLLKKKPVTNKAVIKSDSALEIGSVLVDLGSSLQRVSENPKYKKTLFWKTTCSD